MYATQKHALTEARQYERAPASVGSAASTFQQMAGQAGNQAMLALLGQRSEPAATGESLPNAIMQRFERKSGVPLDDVRVHYNSDKPDKFDAEAYARGNEIFIGPGNEQDLEHEVGHVVQQKMGQVRSTGIEHGFAVNRSPALEHGADVGAIPQAMGAAAVPVVQCCGDKTEEGKRKALTEESKNVEPFSADQLEEAELIGKEKELFTNGEFKGASISDHEVAGKVENRVGSLYFGGTSLEDDLKENPFNETIKEAVEEYLEENENYKMVKDIVKNGKSAIDAQKGKLEECKKKLYNLFKEVNIEYGGRIRTAHEHGPEITCHGRILRMKDPREEGVLLEIFCDDTGKKGKYSIHSHQSRGTFVKAGSNEDVGGVVTAIEKYSKDRPDFFPNLANRAKAAQKYYEDNDKTNEAAKQANERFTLSLIGKEKEILPMNPIDERKTGG